MPGRFLTCGGLPTHPLMTLPLEPAALPKRTAAYPVRPFCSPSNSSSPRQTQLLYSWWNRNYQSRLIRKS